MASKDKSVAKAPAKGAASAQQAAQAQQQGKPVPQGPPADLTILETSGILDSYEYFLRQVCKNGLPQGNVFEFAAQQILKFEKKREIELKKRSALTQSLEALEQQQQLVLEQQKEKEKSTVAEVNNKKGGKEPPKKVVEAAVADASKVDPKKDAKKK